MKQPGVNHLFVYGSLRSGFKSDAYHYISRFFNLVGPARVKGKLYDLGQYPAALPTEENCFIIGELYEVKDESEFSWAIGQLDDYEGVNVEADEVQLYRRELVEVFINERKIAAWIYWYNEDVSGKPVVDSGDILEYLKSK